MFMGFTLHFYIIFGTNLLTGGPTRIAVFSPISVFRRKGISNGVQTEWNLRARSFRNKRNPGDLDWVSSSKRGGHEGSWRAPTLVGPSWVNRPTSVAFIYSRTLKTSRSTTKNYFRRRNLLYPRDPILEPLSVLRWKGNPPWRASTSSPRPLRWVVSSLPQTFGSIVII